MPTWTARTSARCFSRFSIATSARSSTADSSTSPSRRSTRSAKARRSHMHTPTKNASRFVGKDDADRGRESEETLRRRRGSRRRNGASKESPEDLRPALQGSRRNELRGTVGDDDGPGPPHLQASEHRGRAGSRPVFDMLMGTDVPARKSFIQSHAKEATLDI